MANMTNSREEPFVLFNIPLRELQYDSNGGFEYSPAIEHHRAVRSPSTCKVPESMENSELRCKLYPSSTTCRQICKFGFTLEERIELKVTCKHDEDQWKPSGFGKCKPFIDCSLTLGPGGKYKCWENSVVNEPNCEVSCELFEDIKAVKKKNYNCTITGKWKPRLPFCAKAGTGIQLVAPPVGPKLVREIFKNYTLIDGRDDDGFFL